MSGSNIGDGLVTTLLAASAFDSRNVSKNDYGILESTTACALIVQPASFGVDEHTYGRKWATTWNLAVECYVRDLGNAQETLDNTWKIADEILGAVKADESLDSSACSAIVRTGDRPRDTYVEAGGIVWLPWYITVEALEVF